MNTVAYIELGVIQRIRGLQGHVVAWLSYDASHLDGLRTLFIQIKHTLVPYCIEQLSLRRRKAIIKLQGVDDPKTAQYLQGCLMFVPQEVLPQLSPQEDDSARLLGYHVADVQEGSLGPVKAIYTPSQQSLLAIDYQGQELLVPYHEDIVTCVNHERGIISVALPADFVETMLH